VGTGLAVRLQVAFLPRDVPTPDGRVCVVLDVLRASSTLVTLLERGAAPVYVAGTVDEARALAARLGLPALLCGEVGGLPPPGFDYGNSPTEMAGLALGGRPVVLATSNGTRALAALATAPAVLVGCFRNAAAVAERAVALARALGADLTLVCSGDEQGSLFSLEDALAAGYLADLVLIQTGEPVPELDDAARAAWRLWGAYAAGIVPAEGAARGFADSVHGRDLARLGFHADLAYCARPDASRAVPRLIVDGDQLVLRDAGA
jgi:2-phosphosulfolactate phosphatase